jgi:hypothetical protein
MLLKKTSLFASLLCAIFTLELGAQVKTQLPDEINTQGMDRGLARILDRYYEESFGGIENWQSIETVRFEGEYLQEGKTTRFIGLRKKPNLLKLTIFFDDETRGIMSYDGSEAWSMVRGKRETPPALIDERDARRLIADSVVGGPLLFPQQEGKKIRLKGSATVGGDTCYEIEVTLPDGTISTHLIDANRFLERRTIRLDKKTGVKHLSTHSDFRKVDGVYFSFQNKSEIDGEIVREIFLEDVKTNVGIPSWAFERPEPL